MLDQAALVVTRTCHHESVGSPCTSMDYTRVSTHRSCWEQADYVPSSLKGGIFPFLTKNYKYGWIGNADEKALSLSIFFKSNHFAELSGTGSPTASPCGSQDLFHSDLQHACLSLVGEGQYYMGGLSSPAREDAEGCSQAVALLPWLAASSPFPARPRKRSHTCGDQTILGTSRWERGCGESRRCMTENKEEGSRGLTIILHCWVLYGWDYICQGHMEDPRESKSAGEQAFGVAINPFQSLVPKWA